MSKYEEWYDYEDYDDEYEDEKNIYELIYYENGEKQDWITEKDFEDILLSMSCYNICDSVKVIDKRDGSDVTEEFNKFLKEQGFIFRDEAEKEIPESVLQNLPKVNEYDYFHYGKDNFLKLFNLSIILHDSDAKVLWKFGYFLFGYADKLDGFENEVLLFIDRTVTDSPVYAIYTYHVWDNSTKEDIQSKAKVFCTSFLSLREKLESISDEDDYNRQVENSKHLSTPEEEQEKYEQQVAKEQAIEEKLRGEKLDYSIENIEYKGSTFELLKFKYHEKEYVYSTESLGIKIAEAGDIGSDLEKSIIEFLEDDEFDSLKKKIAEVPYWNRFMEYCNDCFIRNDTVFYGGGDFMFRHHGIHFYKIRLSYDHMMFGYMRAQPGYSEEELKQIANDNRCNEVLDKDRFYKMQKFMDEAHRFAEEFSQFCAENDIPNVIEGHTVERVFDFNDFIDDAYDDEWDKEDEYNDEEYDEDAEEDDEE